MHTGWRDRRSACPKSSVLEAKEDFGSPQAATIPRSRITPVKQRMFHMGRRFPSYKIVNVFGVFTGTSSSLGQDLPGSRGLPAPCSRPCLCSTTHAFTACGGGEAGQQAH